jgi:hypothetical protein
MRKILFALAISTFATSTVAQPPPSTVVMSCGKAAALVASAGAIVLGTGGHTYERFVRARSLCVYGEATEPV